MLSASGGSPKQPPRPANWRGVDRALAEARAALAAGQAARAAALAREALEFAPREARAWRLLAEALQASGQTAEAQAARAEAEQLARADPPARPPASKRLAKLLWAQGEREAARAMLAVLLLRHPDDDEIQRLAAAWEEEAA